MILHLNGLLLVCTEYELCLVSVMFQADQLFRDENTLMVYELLDNFCEFIRLNLSYICKRRYDVLCFLLINLHMWNSCFSKSDSMFDRDCGDELIDEAVSSLVFASSRCGDLPELRAIRKLFEERFGQIFVRSAADLLPGNLVNQQVINYNIILLWFLFVLPLRLYVSIAHTDQG